MIYIEFAHTGPSHESQHLCGENLARVMLEKYSSKDSVNTAICTYPSGKPYFREEETVDFSVSHSGETVLCAIYCPDSTDAKGAIPFPEDGILRFGSCYFIEADNDSPKIGADIETVDTKMTEERLSSLAKRYFHAEENAFIEKDGFSRIKFYTVWTKKESFGKMLGTGLKGILSGFDVTSETAAVIKNFTLKKDGVSYVGAVCFKP